MNLNPTFFNSVFVFPILNLMVFLYQAFNYVKLPGAFGLAIIGLTVIVRGAFNPFFKQQIQTSQKLNKLKPEIDILTKRYKNDQKQLQAEQLKLYQREGINPAAGCLFMIIQFPIFIGLYQTLSLFLVNGEKAIGQINKVLYSPALKITHFDPWFLGINLTITPKAGGSWPYLLIPLITGILQYFQAQSTMMTAAKPAEKKIEKKPSDEKKEDSEDFQKAMNTQMKYFLPLMVAWFAYTLPIGLSLYWNIFSIFGIVQYRKHGQTKKN